jgi:hypothetical protein
VSLLKRILVRSSIILTPVLLITWCVGSDQRQEAQFAKVLPGMSPAQVVEQMGKPTWDGKCGAKMPTGLPKQCTREMGYRTPLAPLVPSYYLVWFGRDGLVTSSAPINSP